MNRATTAPSIVGLVVSVGGVALLASPASRLLGDPERLQTRMLEQLCLWLLFAAILAVVLLWERRPLSSIGLRPFGWRSLVGAAALAATVIFVVSPLATRLVAATGLATFEAGIAGFAALPLWFKVFAVVTAGVVEETLFRGFAFERLAVLLNSDWLAALLTLLVFTIVHWPVWGTGAVLVIFCNGCVLTLFYVWQRDLTANILAHVAVDAVGLLLVPALSGT